MRPKITDAVYNEMAQYMLLELNAFVTQHEKAAKRSVRLDTTTARFLLNYIFELEQDLRWNTSKYGVVPPIQEEESDGRLENLKIP